MLLYLFFFLFSLLLTVFARPESVTALFPARPESVTALFPARPESITALFPARPERAEAPSPGHRPGYSGRKSVAL